MEERFDQLIAGGTASLAPDVLGDLMRVAGAQARYVMATRLGLEILSRPEPRDPGVPDRFDVVRCAALAGCGKGVDAATATDVERQDFRRRALSLFREEIDAWRETRRAGRTPASRLRTILDSWLFDPALAGVRDREPQGQLPPPEAAAWRGLWKAVDALFGECGN